MLESSSGRDVLVSEIWDLAAKLSRRGNKQPHRKRKIEESNRKNYSRAISHPNRNNGLLPNLPRESTETPSNKPQKADILTQRSSPKLGLNVRPSRRKTVYYTSYLPLDNQK